MSNTSSDFYRATLSMLACNMLSSCPSVCLSHAGIVPKRLNAGSRKQRHRYFRDSS